MMKHEFCEIAGIHDISLDQYEIIETVYMYHPAIDSKTKIADIFKKFGMIVIKDMLERAEKIRVIENRIQQKRAEIAQLEEEKASFY